MKILPGLDHMAAGDHQSYSDAVVAWLRGVRQGVEGSASAPAKGHLPLQVCARSKVTYWYGKRDLLIWQQGPTDMAKETLLTL